MFSASSTGPDDPAPCQWRENALQVANRAIDWVNNNLELFIPLRKDEEVDSHRQKALVELSLLCYYMERSSTFRKDVRLWRFLRCILKVYKTPWFGDRLFRVENAFVPHALLANVLFSCGLLIDEGQRAAIQRIVDHTNICFVEKTPHRLLELHHIFAMGGYINRLPCPRTLFLTSLLAKRPSILRLSKADAYSITHTIFYLSDFGHKPITVMSASHKRHAYWIVENLLGAYIHLRHWDLVAELILSHRCLVTSTSDLCELGWHRLRHVQLTDGSIPAGGCIDRGLEAPVATGMVGTFDNNYHTALVAILAAVRSVG
jgi:hypothetical protein